jgi:hypothetical protein
MANWHHHVAAAAQFFQNVERAMSDNCIRFDEVTLYPWQSNGGRSNGVTAHFYRRNKGDFYVTLYEHWNSDQLDLQFNRNLPSHIMNDEKHDTPHLQYGPDKLHIAMLAVQTFLLYWFGDNLPKDMYYAKDFGGMYIAARTDRDAAHDDIFNGPIVDHMSVCDKCDNTVRLTDGEQKNDEFVCYRCSGSKTMRGKHGKENRSESC